MSNLDLNEIKVHAKGQWQKILTAAGLNATFLKKKNGPCPFCEGHDRWNWNDKDGDGTGFCRRCDAKGDGFRLVAKLLNLDQRRDFPKILAFVAEQIGYDIGADKTDNDQVSKSDQARDIFDRSVPIKDKNASPVHLYLRGRGLDPNQLGTRIRISSSLPAYLDNVFLGNFPAMVAGIANAHGVIVGIHRTFLTESGSKVPALGGSAKQIKGICSKGVILLSDKYSDVVNVAEGIETAVSAMMATGIPGIAAPTGSVLKDVPIPVEVKKVHIWVDKDLSRAGEDYSEALAARLKSEGKQVFLHIPADEIAPGKKGVDWNDVLQKNGVEPLISAFSEDCEWNPKSDHNEGRSRQSTGWADRLPLPSHLPPVPELDPEMIPIALRPWILDLSERLQLPKEFFIGSALSMIGSAIGTRCGIHPKVKDDWIVIPCVWGCLIGLPSVKKSPAMSATIAPLKKVEAEARASFEEELKKHNDFVEEQEAMMDFAVKNAKKGKDESKLKQAMADNKEAKDKIKSSTPWLRRYITNDPTTEKLGELLKENRNGLFVFRDELHGFLMNLEKSGRESDRAFYLEAWGGLGSYTFDRIGRGTTYIPNLCASIFGGIQPDRLKSYFSFVMEEGSGDDGFLSRFQLLLFPDLPKSFSYTDKYPDLEARNKVVDIVRRIVKGEFEKRGAELDKLLGIPAFHFDEDGQNIFKNWYEAFNQRLLDISAEESSAFVAHLGKYRSLFPSLALIFHIVDNCEGEFLPKQVSAESAQKAAYWVDFLEQHAKRVYSPVRHPEIHAAHALLKKIKQRKIRDGMTVRDVYRSEWSGLKKSDVVREGLALLEKLGWLKVTEVSLKGIGAPSEVISLHPDLIAELSNG